MSGEDGEATALTEADVVALATALPGVAAVTASAATGAPEVAWGDTFLHYGSDRRMPFATVVVKDYPGFDTASDLDRDGVFRVNVGVGRAWFEELLGYPPSAVPAGVDHTVFDTVLPHPTYAAQGWVSIVCPGPATADVLRGALAYAHDRVARRHRPAPPR